MDQRAFSLGLLGGFGTGAGLVYLLDPLCGGRRRAHLRDELVHDARTLGITMASAVRDLSHRARGVTARLHRLTTGAGPDEVVEQRARAALGWVCSHPGAVEVICDGGRAQLSGPVLASEHRAIVSAVRRVRGIRDVVDLLEAHERAEGIPDLQGGVPRGGRRLDILQRHWAPSTALLAGAAGAGLLVAGWRARQPIGWTAATAGALLLGRALFNRPLKEVVGLGAGRRGVEIQKVIHVRAPVEEVFAFWSNLESFPRFMTHVKEVQRTGERQYHWKVGPFEWEAELTQFEPNRLLAWRSLPAAAVENAGRVCFRPDNRRGTEIEVRLSYQPPAGMVGHGIARLLGADPRKQMDDDLLRFKTLIEQGKATGRGEQVTRDEIGPATLVTVELS